MTVQQRLDMYHEQYNLLRVWVENLQQGKRLDRVLLRADYKNIIVYGDGALGKLLIDEIKDDRIKILSILDKKGNKIFDESIEPDAIIVTPVYHYEIIECALRKDYQCPIVSLTDLAYRL